MRALRHAFEHNDAMRWGSYLEFKTFYSERDNAREKPHLSQLDEYFTEHPPFKGNEMRRLRTVLEERAIVPSFRTLLDMDELEIQDLMDSEQIGVAADNLVMAIRDDQSFWIKLKSTEIEEEEQSNGLLHK